jgi:hypothetical protein
VLNVPTALLSAALVGATTWAARRWGPRAGGWLSGLPVVVGPILVVLAIEHGGDFAARAAGGALLGLLTIPAFVVAYAWVARYAPWPAAVVAGWAPAAGIGWLIQSVRSPAGVSLALGAVALVAAARALPAGSPDLAPVRGDVAIRCALTAAIVWTATEFAGALGPELSGIVASLPLLATILAAFTHAHDGPTAATTLLRGMLVGLASYAGLCFLVAVSG